MASYTVTDVREGNRDNYGNQAYYIDTVEGPEGVYFKCKPKNAPQVGQSYEWELDTSGEYGPRFRRPAQEQGGGGNSPQGGAQRRSGGNQMTPDREAKIVRQHSQQMALMYAALHPDEAKDLTALKAVIDWFDEDAMGAVPQAAAAATPSLDQMRQKLQDDLKAAQVPVSDGVAAIGALYGRTQLEATDDINAIVAKAKELATEPTPF